MREIFAAIWMVILSTHAAQADVLGLNDYDLIFEENAADIVVGEDGTETLNLPGGVRLSRLNSQLTGAYDLSGEGALGCSVMIMSELQGYQKYCEGPMSDAAVERLDEQMDTVLDFYARNAYPPTDLGRAREAYDTMVKSRTGCRADPYILSMLEQFNVAEMSFEADDLDGVDRLPVNNPCL